MPNTESKNLAERLEQVASTLFFIVGCGRSGTTFLQSVILSHPDVAIPPETKFASKFPAYTPGLRDLTNASAFAKALDVVVEDQRRKGVAFDEARFRELAHAAPRTWDGVFLAVLTAFADRENRPRAGEKSPAHTPLVGRLSESFPHAKFVHLLRDPRAVMLSRVRAGFTAGALGTEIPRWKEAADMHRDHADRLGPSRYHLLRYEDLVTDLEPTVRSLCAFLDLDMRPEMLEPHKRQKKGFNPNSKDWMQNTLKPVFTGSIDKWRSDLTTSQIALIEHALADDMRAMGYEPTGASTAAPGLKLAVSRAVGKTEYARRKAIRGVRKLSGRKPAPPPIED
ncbi:MAG: sulfotransferase family protein [Phycisphaerales bacterium]